MQTLIQIISFSLLLNVSYTSSVCMNDCTSSLTPHPPSLYEQYCCNDDNTGKTIKLKDNISVTRVILCPSRLPKSCQRFPTILNCSELLTADSSAPLQSGYYTIQASNGSQILVYCNLDDYIDGYNCSEIFNKNSSSPPGYYKINFNGSILLKYCAFDSCAFVLEKNSSALSGYYTMQTSNGSRLTVYCDMEGNNCYGKGGWMRISYLNMSEPDTVCPTGLMLKRYTDIDHDLCGRPVSSSGNQSSVIFTTYGVSYNNICGQVRGYQFGSPDGFPPMLGGGGLVTNPSIDTIYVDGISITYDNPRKHIWTYAGGLFQDKTIDTCCPCNNGSMGTEVPSFVGNDHYCESGTSGHWSSVLYSKDVLWDGQQCSGLEGPCCINLKMPWFSRTLNETTTENIELRVMASEETINEDTPLDIIELYIR